LPKIEIVESLIQGSFRIFIVWDFFHGKQILFEPKNLKSIKNKWYVWGPDLQGWGK
jgi:hypothetical protein